MSSHMFQHGLDVDVVALFPLSSVLFAACFWIWVIRFELLSPHEQKPKTYVSLVSNNSAKYSKIKSAQLQWKK